MRWVLSLIMMCGATQGYAEAPPNDEVQEALKLLRRRVVAIDPTPAGQLIRFGSGSLVAGFMTALAVPYSHAMPNTSPLPTQFLWVPAGLGALGAVGLAIGHYLKKEADRLPRPRPEWTHYQTPDGLSEFMALPHDQQEARLREDPEFADFIVRLAEAYRFVVDHRVPDGCYPFCPI